MGGRPARARWRVPRSVPAVRSPAQPGSARPGPAAVGESLPPPLCYLRRGRAGAADPAGDTGEGGQLGGDTRMRAAVAARGGGGRSRAGRAGPRAEGGRALRRAVKGPVHPVRSC